MSQYADYGIDIPSDAGEEVRVLCPECSPHRKSHNQKKRVLCVNTEKGTWFCQHCGWSGGLGHKQDKSCKDKYQRPLYRPNKLPDGMVKWFKKRGISENTLAEANVGYLPPNGKPSGAIMFPRYKDGAVVAIKYRTHDKTMWQSLGPEPCFYNRDAAIKTGQDKLIICEGEIDALTCIEAGLPNTVSVPNGAPSLNAKNFETEFEYLKDGTVEKFSSFVLAVDNDEPGKILERELSERLSAHSCLRVQYPDDCKDLNDVLVKHGAGRVRQIVTQAKPYPIDGLYTAEDVLSAVVDLYDQGLKPGLSTGWPSVDNLYTVRTCEMTVVTGIPGSGKSTWLDSLTVNMNKLHGWRIAYCSPENWPIQRHIANIVEKITLKPFATHTKTSPRMTKEELNEALKVITPNFYFTELGDNGMNVDNVLNVMQSAISRYNVKGIVLDPWNELEYHRPQNLTETEYVSQALGKIRRFARLNDVHVWIVAHPTKIKANEDNTYPVPRLYDISGSAHWYNKADNGICIHRPRKTIPHVEVHVQKIRFREIGKLGTTQLKFISDCGTYKELGEIDMEEVKRKAKSQDTAPF